MFGATFSAQLASRSHMQILGCHALNQTVPGPAGTLRFIAPFASGLSAATLFATFPVAGILSNMVVMITSPQPGSGSLVFTLSALAGNLVIIVPAGAATFSIWTTTFQTLALAVNDNIAITIRNNAAVASAQIAAITVRLDMPS